MKNETIFLTSVFCFGCSPFFVVHMSLISGGLTDAHILELSENITNLTDLRELGVRVLGLKLQQIESAHTNSKTINEAACNILQKWRRKQNSPQEALILLCAQLRQVGWNQLVRDLLDHYGESSKDNLTPQSKEKEENCTFPLV